MPYLDFRSEAQEIAIPSHSSPLHHGCELTLRDAECLAVLHPDGVFSYPVDELLDARKLHFLNRYRQVNDLGERIIENIFRDFSVKIDTSSCLHPLLVWNTLSFERGGLVTIPWEGGGNVLALTPRNKLSRTQLVYRNGVKELLVEMVDVPSVGYVTYDLIEDMILDETPSLVTDVAYAGDRYLENNLVLLKLNEFGEVASLTDKIQGRELIDDTAPGNCLLQQSSPACISVLENGPLRAALRVERLLEDKSHLVQYIHLEANSRRIVFETFISCPGVGYSLRISFPVNIHSPSATFDTEVPPRWVDLSGKDYGFALLNDGNLSFDIQGNVMCLSASPSECAGRSHFTFILLPHRGDITRCGVPLASYDLNVPLRAHRLPVQEGVMAQMHSYFRLDRHNLIIESIKRAAHGDGIIVKMREVYSSGGAARLIFNGLCSHASRVNFNGEDEELDVKGGSVRFNYDPYEIIEIRLK